VNYKTSGCHWVIDSGCTQHMTGNPRMFTSLDENVDGQDKITFGDNSKGKVQGLGKVAISNDLSISNVLLVAPLSFNLLSVGQLCDLGLQCLFTPTEVIVSKMDDESMVFKGFRYNNLYLVDFTSEDADLRTCLFTKASLGWLWHRRLAHVGMSTLKKVLKKDMVRGLKDVVFEKDKPCSACQAGKQVANTHPTKAFMSTSRPQELLHMDLFGPTNYVSVGGNLYCLVIVDDFSRYTWVFFLHDKSKVASIFKKFAKKAQNEFDCKIKKIRSDNGKEFDNTNIHEYYDEIGIKHEVSATYTPLQNGVVKRKNRTLITLARTMIDEYNTPERFWAEAVNTTCYASNRLFPHRLLAKTPYKLLNGKKPDVSFFRVFGCKCYIYKKRHHLGKFQRRCDIGFLLGYSLKSNAYRVFSHATGVVEETYDVEFDETNGSQGALENLDDVGDEPLREAMKNMPIGVIKPKDDKEEVQNIDRPSSSNVPQDDEKDERHANEDTFVSHEQARVQAEDVDAPGSSSQVVNRRNSSLLQAHPQNQIIGSPSQGVITRSHRHDSFIEHHSFVSCVEPTCIDEALQDPVAHRTVSGAPGWLQANWPLSGIHRRHTTIIHQTVRWCTGLSGEPTVTSATVGHQIRGRRVARSNGRQEAPDYPVCTEQCPVRQRLQFCNGRLCHLGRRSAPDHEQCLSGGAPDCPVHHPIEGKNCLPRLPPTAPSCLGAIKGTPRHMEEISKHSLIISKHQDSILAHLILCDSDLSSI
jgi:transposase InsO family protein